MKTKYLFLAALTSIALVSCMSDEFVGDNSPTAQEATKTEGINFGFKMPNATRADIAGPAAADLLGNIFYVTGTKGTEGEKNPTPTLVFDNYLVHYAANTAGTTESNTANWEYVGIQPETGDYTNYAYLTSMSPARAADLQTIKYWDYSVAQYDFLAFSTGKNMKAVNYSSINLASIQPNEIGVEAMKYGTGLSVASTTPDAYKFFIPSVAALEKTFITDITEVLPANYGNEVTLKFKNLGSKVRVALYETVPGYSVKDVVFYTVDGTSDFTDTYKDGNAKLISANASGLPTNGTIRVQFPHVGTFYQPGATNAAQDYDKASAIVESPASNATYDKYKDFGALTAQLKGADKHETATPIYLGRTLADATFAGLEAAKFYKTVFPVSTSDPLTLRVDYTLVPIDGASETIKVWGAKAVVPSEFTKWQPNYAYTYIFKISDNTNGWTTETVTGTTPAGLFPITFDAVVAEATDANAEQTTITTVATPTITTYQQNHNPNKNGAWISTNEYSKATGKNIYVQVMDNKDVPATLKDDLNDNTPEGKAKSLLYAIDASHAATATEAMVMDALEKRTAEYDGDAATITGRNSLVLTKQAITNKVNTIVNGVDDNPIDITLSGDKKSKAAMITITGTGALGAGTYAYVYDYTETSRNQIEEYQPIVPGVSYIESDASSKTFYYVTPTQLGALPDEPAVDLTAADANDYLYFSKTTNGSGTTTYSYISIVGKKTLPAGVVKIAKSTVNGQTALGNTAPQTGYIYFDKYFSNNGMYAVKVIKVTA